MEDRNLIPPPLFHNGKMESMKLKKLLFVTTLALLFIFPSTTYSQGPPPPKNETIEATVTDVAEGKTIDVDGREQLHQTLQLIVTDGSIKGKNIRVENGDTQRVNVPEYKAGDKVIVTATKDFEGNDKYFIQDYIRRDSLYLLFFFFLVVAVVIGLKRGILALVGMAFSFLIIFSFILPQISQGRDPILIAVIASIAIIPVTFYLSHGINRKTTSAIIGTFIALVLTGILANVFVEAARLTGFASEEAGFLQNEMNGQINIKGLLLAGIIVSVLGILDDITVSQAAVVYQLKKLSPTLGFKDLYLHAMDVGRDHIASVVNTLVLVYTGAALPLLLLFVNSSRPFGQVINHEVIAEEIIRTLVSSIGLILAVPITTLLTAYVASMKKHVKK